MWLFLFLLGEFFYGHVAFEHIHDFSKHWAVIRLVHVVAAQELGPKWFLSIFFARAHLLQDTFVSSSWQRARRPALIIFANLMARLLHDVNSLVELDHFAAGCPLLALLQFAHEVISLCPRIADDEVDHLVELWRHVDRLLRALRFHIVDELLQVI